MSKIFLILLLFLSLSSYSQQNELYLYPGTAPGSENWTWNEAVSDKNSFNTRIVYNVVRPSISVFLPEPSAATGAAVIICPGGGFETLSIESEGNELAR